jgi:hypothetical protein
MEDEKADKLARLIASDYGAAIRHQGVTNAGIKRSSAKNGNGKINLNETTKVKGATETYALTCMEALKWAAEAGKHGFVYAHTQWVTSPAIAEYLSSL